MSLFSRLSLKTRALGATALVLLCVLGLNTAANIYAARGKYLEALMNMVSAEAEMVLKDINKAVGFGVSLDSVAGLGDRLRALAERSDDIAYIMVMDADGKVLYASDPAVENTQPKGPGALKALSAEAPLVFEHKSSGSGYYEKAIPILSLENKKIGVLRIALSASAVNRQTRSLLFVTSAFGTAAFVIATLLVYVFMKRAVANPLGEISRVVAGLASGDLTRSVYVTGKSEIAELGAAINSISSSLREVIGRLRQMGSSLGEAAALITTVTRKLSNGSRVQYESTEQTAMTAEEMVASIHGVAENAAAMSASAADASSAVSEMAASIEEVAENAGVLSDAAESTASSISQMLAAIGQVTSSVEALSSSAEETSSTITEISASVREVEKGAIESARLAEKVSVEAAERGVAAAGEAIHGMDNIKAAVQAAAEVINRLGRRSQEIGRILKVIDEVTDQTGLLALNAAILAAQAGEHGKGFSVIAEEIKDLADRTAASTSEIAGLISVVRRETEESVQAMERGLKAVESGADLVRVTSDVLEQVAESSRKAADTARAIERTTAEQTKGVSQTTEAVIGITMQIEQISRAMQEQRAGGEQIMRAAEQMRDITRRVKHATKEQTTVGRQIAQAMDAVTIQAGRVARSTAEQQKGMAQIRDAVVRIQKITEESVDLSIELDMAMQTLKGRAESLKDELDRFVL